MTARATHTPGPWSAFTRGNTVSVCIGAIPYGKRPCIVDWSGFADCDLPISKQRANAHLIAASPEMYAALLESRKAIVSIPKEAFGIGGDGETHWYLADELLRQIDMAIAKAKGEIYEE